MIYIDEFAPQLGNRLFQLAAAIDLADRNLDTVNFPEWKYNKHFYGLHHTKFDSENQPEYAYQEPFFHYSPIPYQRNLYLKQSYLQSEKYFKSSETKIRRMFRVLPQFSRTIVGSLVGYATCSIHVRRGDYAQFPDHHPILGMDYFNKAIDIIQRNNNFVQFYIFSDDLDWCRDNFPNSENFSIMNGNEIEDFSAMSSCDHNIIANSSFSWWGAWLNSNKNKTVIAPKNWFGPALSFHNTKDLIPEGWTVI